MSLRDASRSLSSALGTSGVRINLTTDIVNGTKRELKRAQKAASSRGKEVLGLSAKAANGAMGDRLSQLGRNVKSRYRNREVPSIDPYSRRRFPKGYPKTDRGELRSGLISAVVKKNSRETFRDGIAASITIRASSVSPNTDEKNWPKPVTTAYPNLTKVKWSDNITTYGGKDDLFSMMEYGTGHMRYSPTPYTTFSGEVFSRTQGYFVLDRIVKDEFYKLSKTVNQSVVDAIRNELA